MIKISDLSFIYGSWIGDGFIMQFSKPANTMLFGSMQAADKDGRTVYWETFRFEIVDDQLLLHTITLNRDTGTYILTDSDKNFLEFSGLRNFDEKVQKVYFESNNPSKELILSVSGINGGNTYKQEWVVKSE